METPPKTAVAVVDMDDHTLYSRAFFTDQAQAQAFADGMEAAWEISHGPANCWSPFVMDADALLAIDVGTAVTVSDGGTATGTVEKAV